MGIVQITTDVPAQIGVAPRRVKILSSDNLATVTAAGYLNTASLEGYTIYATDIIDMWYSYVSQNNPGTYAVFTPAISNGVITLSENVNPGNVLLPVVSGDFAVFNGTSGQIKDAGYLPTDSTKTSVVMLNAAPTSGHIAAFTNANGTIGDGGVLGTAAAKAASNNSDATVASVAGATVAGNLLKANDTAGTVADQGVAFKSVAGASVAGGAAAQTITDAFCTSGACVVGNWNTQANAVTVQKIVPGNGSFVVTSSGDPGASTFNYIITK